MKLCYVDESGDIGQDPCLIMVGILVDSSRLRKTQEEFSKYFSTVKKLFNENLTELKGAMIIHGRKRWRNVSLDDRKKIVEDFVNWIDERKHDLIVTAVDREKWGSRRSDSEVDIQNIWLTSALHIALRIQRLNKSMKNNKGRTLLIIDDNKTKADKLSDLLWNTPTWTDSYCRKKEREDRLNQIIDTPFSIKSHHGGLVQVADLLAFILRRYAEIKDYESREVWPGEGEWIENLINNVLAKHFNPKPGQWLLRPQNNVERWFSDITPSCLKTLKQI